MTVAQRERRLQMMVMGARDCLPMLIAALIIAGCGDTASDPIDAAADHPSTHAGGILGVDGEYLGQVPPGRAFTPFAPGIVSPELIHSVTVSPDGQEIYWATRDGIMTTRRVEDGWTTPDVVWFSGRGSDFFDDAPVVSPDDTKLFFNSRRPSELGGADGYTFWYSERTATGWSEPQALPDVVSSLGGIHWQVSEAGSGTLYFGVISQDGIGIYRSRRTGGVYASPEPLGAINAMGDVICPFVAPDESYLIFNRVVEGRSDGYYVSFRGTGAEWLAPQRMTEFPEGECSFVSRDGRYVFSKNYWASAEIIEDRRPE